MLRCVTLCVLAFVSFAHCSKASVEGQKSIKYVAHRGDYPDVPEGSMAAYHNAVERGSEIVKLDVHTSKDNVIVLSHDSSFSRTMGWAMEISSATWEEIQRHSYLFGGRPTNEKAVSLPEALKVLGGIPEFWVDFKYFIEMLADVNNDTVAYHLPCNRSASGSGDKVGLSLLGFLYEEDDILFILRESHANRHLTICRGIGGVCNAV